MIVWIVVAAVSLAGTNVNVNMPDGGVYASKQLCEFVGLPKVPPELSPYETKPPVCETKHVKETK